MNHLLMVTSTLFFLVPMVLLVFIYSGIMCVIKQRRRELRHVTRSDRSTASSSTNAAHTHLVTCHAANGATGGAAAASGERRHSALSTQIFEIKPSSHIIALRMPTAPKNTKRPGPGLSPTHESPRRQLTLNPTGSRLNNKNHVSPLSPTDSRVKTPLSRYATAIERNTSSSPSRKAQSSAKTFADITKTVRQPVAQPRLGRRVSFMEEEADNAAASQTAVGGATHAASNGSNSNNAATHSQSNTIKTVCAQANNTGNALRLPGPERRSNSLTITGAGSSAGLLRGVCQSPGAVRRSTLDPSAAPGLVLRRESTRSRAGSVDAGVSAAAHARRNRSRNSVGTLLGVHAISMLL